MAIGDEAAAAGLATRTSAAKVNDTHTFINQALDYIARVMTRTTKLEDRLNTSPVVILRSSLAQSTDPVSNTWRTFRWNVAEFNRGGMFAAASQSNIVCTKAGVVTIDATVKFGIQTESVVRIRLTRNGVVVPGTTIDDQRGSAQAEPIAQLSTKLKVNAGDVLTIQYGSERSNATMRSAECRMTVDYSTLD